MWEWQSHLSGVLCLFPGVLCLFPGVLCLFTSVLCLFTSVVCLSVFGGQRQAHEMATRMNSCEPTSWLSAVIPSRTTAAESSSVPSEARGFTQDVYEHTPLRRSVDDAMGVGV